MQSEQPDYFNSAVQEKVLEHQFIAALTSCLWRCGLRDIEVLRSEVDDLDWSRSLHFAHLIDGYRMCETLGLGNPFEFEAKQLAYAAGHGDWRGGPAVLWATLFLEHRRIRQQGFEPDQESRELLDRLCAQLVKRLKDAFSSAPCSGSNDPCS